MATLPRAACALIGRTGGLLTEQNQLRVPVRVLAIRAPDDDPNTPRTYLVEPINGTGRAWVDSVRLLLDEPVTGPDPRD